MPNTVAAEASTERHLNRVALGTESEPMYAWPINDPVRSAILIAAYKLLCLQPARIVGEPDIHDANALVDDIEALAAILDPIFVAIGDYANSHIGLSRQDRDDCFKDVILRAVQGNATHVIPAALQFRNDMLGR